MRLPEIETHVYVRPPIEEDAKTEMVEAFTSFEEHRDLRSKIYGPWSFVRTDPSEPNECISVSDGQLQIEFCTTSHDPQEREEAARMQTLFHAMRVSWTNKFVMGSVEDLEEGAGEFTCRGNKYTLSDYRELWVYEHDLFGIPFGADDDSESLLKRLRRAPKPTLEQVQRKWFDHEFDRRAGSPFDKAVSLQQEMNVRDFAPSIEAEHSAVVEAIRRLEQACDGARNLLQQLSPAPPGPSRPR